MNSTGQGSSGSNSGLASGGAGGQQTQKGQPYYNVFRCLDHPSEDVKGFCKDCSSGICFRCAISKHRSHNIVTTDEITKADLEPMLDTFDQKLQQLRDKASLILDKAKSSETNAEKLPEIQKYFEKIKHMF